MPGREGVEPISSPEQQAAYRALDALVQMIGQNKPELMAQIRELKIKIYTAIQSRTTSEALKSLTDIATSKIAKTKKFKNCVKDIEAAFK